MMMIMRRDAIFHLSLKTSVTVILLIASLFSASSGNKAPTLHVSLSWNEGTLVKASEETPVKSLVGIVQVVDDDPGPAGQVNCQTENDFIDLVIMAPNAYKIELARNLDRELVESFDVTIVCNDAGNPPKTSTALFSIIVQDENDNAPIFTQDSYDVGLLENQPESSKVFRVTARDDDAGENGLFQYSIEPEYLLFKIDPENGDIYTLATIDREVTEEIVFTIRATDFGIPPLSSTTLMRVEILDVNDNYPQILTNELRVREGQPAMSEVGRILGIDSDSGDNAVIQFSMAENHKETMAIPPFLVRHDGSVLAAVPLDRELRDSYTIYVKATDRGSPPLSNVTAVTIYVTDINDNPPIVVRPRDEGDPGLESIDMDSKNNSGILSIDWYCPQKDRVVYQAHGIDKDEGENGRVTYSISFINDDAYSEDSLFKIDPHSGKISLQRCVRKTDPPNQIVSLVFKDHGNVSLEVIATLNVTLDVDFTSLTTPIPTTTTSTTSTTTTDKPSASTSLLSSALLTLTVLSCILFNICFQECFFR